MVEIDEVAKLEHLSLVSKICTELENHLGLNDKDLGKYVKHNLLFSQCTKLRVIVFYNIKTFCNVPIFYFYVHNFCYNYWQINTKQKNPHVKGYRNVKITISYDVKLLNYYGHSCLLHAFLKSNHL